MVLVEGGGLASGPRGVLGIGRVVLGVRGGSYEWSFGGVGSFEWSQRRGGGLMSGHRVGRGV